MNHLCWCLVCRNRRFEALTAQIIYVRTFFPRTWMVRRWRHLRTNQFRHSFHDSETSAMVERVKSELGRQRVWRVRHERQVRISQGKLFQLPPPSRESVERFIEKKVAQYEA